MVKNNVISKILIEISFQVNFLNSSVSPSAKWNHGSSNRKSNILNYTVCASNDIKEAHDYLLPKSFWDGHSTKDLKTMQHLLKYPIWQVNDHIV